MDVNSVASRELFDYMTGLEILVRNLVGPYVDGTRKSKFRSEKKNGVLLYILKQFYHLQYKTLYTMYTKN